jgi:hypothetical protein
MDPLVKLRVRLIAGLAISLTPAVVNANSVARRSSVPPRLLTEPSAVDLCRAGFKSACQKLAPTAMDARQQVQFLGTAPTSPPAITAPISPPPTASAAAHASAGEDARDSLIAKERELARREASLKAREAMLAAAAQSAQRAVPQPVPAPSPDWVRLEAENARLTDALIRLTATTSVKRW